MKAIYKAQLALPPGQRLVPMGQLAAALAVVPGTATTMVKALAESGLVEYEPYAGVRLTEAGERLAALVLRRHRLIELFLVKVMGMSWAEVHDEAEHLEHAVSDRLIQRIDEILGHPSVDPHGDPIPDVHGTLEQPRYQTLLTCPLHTPVVIARVTDQDAAFLRFVERHDLIPGRSVEVDARDPAADSVRVRKADQGEVVLGMRAASKLLVDVVGALILCLFVAPLARAQPSTGPPPSPFGIVDNSFLVEEAFNQEPGVVQTIFTFARTGTAWELAITQEWPLVTQRHQLSYTLAAASVAAEEENPVADCGTARDLAVHYRLQLAREGRRRPAMAPRVTAQLPLGDGGCPGSAEGFGVQANLPFSKQVGDLYIHVNGGVTFASDATPHVATGLIWRLRPMVHLLVETLALAPPAATPGEQRGGRALDLMVASGLRTGWNLGEGQIVVGLAALTSIGHVRRAGGLFVYSSYERSFRR